MSASPGTGTNDLEQRIAAVLEEKSLLRHPFYREWAEGTLSRARLREYARQYYHFEAAFPRFLSAVHSRSDSPAVRQLLLNNLWDEEHGPRNHVALWLEFAAAVGVSARDVLASKPSPATAALVDHYMQACLAAPVGEALATLYAYEGQVPAIAWEKIKVLREVYGLRPAQFEFFSVHLVSDVAHAGAEVEAIRQSATDTVSVVAAASAACDRLLGFLDGCYATADQRQAARRG
jgi:pyrroloquinoline-quinone synthase